MMENSLTNSNKKLKVLCLHGYRQNGDAFKSKLGSFRKFVNKYADFTFITAPHQAPSLNVEDPCDETQKSWWFNKEDGTFKGTNENGPAYGFEESIKLIEKVWLEEGPFQGLLGFSQGACLVGLICGLIKKGFTTIHPQFVILSSGFLSGSLVHKHFYDLEPFDKFDVDSLHIYGTNDDIIPQHMSESLKDKFRKAMVMEHAGGHYFPATVNQKEFYIEYFKLQLENYLTTFKNHKNEN